jgi:DNA-binding NarL/FixJ family response regulator
MMHGVIRLFVCDDVAELRTLVRLGLADCDDVDVVGEAANGAEAVERVRDMDADVVLLDLAMPVMSGLEALPLLRQAAPDAKVVVYTGYVNDAVEEQALALGASRCMSKTAGMLDVCAAVREVASA